MNKISTLFAGACLFLATNSVAQQSSLAIPKETLLAIAPKLQQEFRQFYGFKKDQQQLAVWLKSLALHYKNTEHEFSIQLPILHNRTIDFNVKNSQTLSDTFLNQHKGIYNLKGESKDGIYTIRVTLSNDYIFASITNKATNERWIIQPATLTDTESLIVYNTKDDLRTSTGTCETNDIHTIDLPELPTLERDVEIGNGRIKTIILGIVSTTQFTTLCGGRTQAATVVANTIDRVSEIYERDLSVQFQLSNLDILNDTNNIFYNNIASQGHSFFLNAAMSYFNNATYRNNIDLGHVFSDLGGGVAYKPSICSSYKFGASSGISYLPSEYFINTVAHEIGHQLNAGHTMSAITGSCGGSTYAKDDSWEIGGGSTIMAYSFACAPLNFVPESYHYFHAGSIQRMQQQLNSNACKTGTYFLKNQDRVNTTNQSAPIIHTPNTTYTIPPNTPFRLKIDATDPDSDELTYSFDQVDTLTNGMTQYPTGTATSGPLFRHIIPSTASERHFPSLANLATGNQNTYEVIPKVARELNFVGLVRDNHDEGGRNATVNFKINVANTADSFAFTNLNTPSSFIANGTNTMLVAWNPASSIVTGNVNIRFSTDNGLTYPHILAANTANDGSETIIVPNFDMCNYNGRIMIEAVDHIAFNVNKAGIQISSANNMAYMGNILPETNIQEEANHPNLNIITQIPNATAIQFPLTQQLSNQVGNYYSSINQSTNACITFGMTHYYDTLVIYPSRSGTYTFNLSNYTLGTLGMEVHKAGFAYNNTNNTRPYCESIIYNSKTHTNTNVLTMNAINNVAIDLCKGEKYIILIHNFSTGSSNTLSNYTLNITGGTLYSDNIGAPSNYHNGYVIYDVNSGLITSIKNNTDLSNGNDFPPSTYMIKGINANQNITTLNNLYQGRPFSELYTAVLQQTNNLDASISPNQRMVTITAPLPIRLINWSGIVNEESQSVLSWSSIEDELFDYYTLESSTDGQTFTTIAHISKQSTEQVGTIQNYQYTDQNFKHYPANTVFYRLKINDKDGQQDYTKVIALHKKNLATHSSIYPNPVKKGDNLRVKVAANNDYQITITNTVGQIIKHEMVAANQNEITFSTKELKAGVYFISIQNDHITEQYKFVVTQ